MRMLIAIALFGTVIAISLAGCESKPVVQPVIVREIIRQRETIIAPMTNCGEVPRCGATESPYQGSVT